MLVSHRKKFIFIKTAKTAGTSVESYFERYCMPEGEWKESHSRQEYFSEAGIIGYRGAHNTFAPKWYSYKWYDHMPAKKINKLIGQKAWNQYFKFTIVRNPFDRLVSSFCMWEKLKHEHTYSRRMREFIRQKFLGKMGPIYRLEGETEIERFRHWMKQGGTMDDRSQYLINGRECIDYFIRFEDLRGGIKHVCNQIEVPYEPSRLPQFMSGIRKNKIKIQDYYDQETMKIVHKMYDWEIERFSYNLPIS